METAISRTPVEIWRHILQLAVEWYRIPGPNDDILKSLLGSTTVVCDRYHIYVESLVYRGKLQLVCRSWDMVIQGMNDHMILTDFEHAVWPFAAIIPRASILEYVSKAKGKYCGCNLFWREQPAHWASNLVSVTTNQLLGYDTNITEDRTLCPMPPFKPEIPTKFDPGIGGLLTKHEWGLIRAKTLLMEGCSEPLSEIFDRPEETKVLSLSPVEITLIPSLLRFANLSHLTLVLTITILDQMTVKPAFLALQELCIVFVLDSLYLRDEDLIPYKKPLSQWEVPKLSVLELKGEVDEVLESLVKADIEGLLSKVCKTIQALVISVSTGGLRDIDTDNHAHWYFASTTWNSFPRLSLFGASLRWFLNMELIPDPLKFIAAREAPMTLFLFDSAIAPYWSNSQGTLCVRNLLRWCQSHPCGIKRIAMRTSWRRSLGAIKSYSRAFGNAFSAARFFFEEALLSELAFCDREGVSLDAEENSWFMEELRAASPYYYFQSDPIILDSD